MTPLERKLRELWKHILDEPIPPDLRHLLSQLDDNPGKGGGGAG